MIFVDSNIFIDIFTADDKWSEWSADAIASVNGKSLVTNNIVLAELARGFSDLSIELGFLRTLGTAILDLTEEAAFRAGKAHADYRAAGGARAGVLADFLIGGHASTLDATLLTRDRQRFATYFPELALITPETDNG